MVISNKLDFIDQDLYFSSSYVEVGVRCVHNVGDHMIIFYIEDIQHLIKQFKYVL